MDVPCRVRDATAADVVAMVAIERAVFPDPWSEGSFRSSLGLGFTLAAERDGTLVAYLVARLAGDEGEILNLAVHPADRRSGIGAQLMAEAHARLTRAGAGTVYLEVRASNGAAQAFYASLGYRQVGLRRDYYRRPREDAMVMARLLGGGRIDAKTQGRG
jgi:ribosomal-protein-alanine N-acetyltransferase